jgi:hypothetical protein
MKYLLSGVAIVAALAFAVPASAQRSGPGPGAGQTTGPGVSPPGGPGPSSPLSNLPAGSPGLPPQAPSPYPPVSPGGAPGMAPGPETTSATPPTRRHVHHAHAHAIAHHTTRATPISGNSNTSANQMNADELARLQAGNTGNPPPSALPYGQPPGGPMPPAR